MLKIPDRADYLMFGSVFVLANKLQFVGDRTVEGLSTKQWFLVRTMMDMPEDPPPTITQIATEMDTTRQNIAKMLEAMQRDGMAVIEENTLDRRSRHVRITEQGKRQARQIAENAQGFMRSLFEGVAPDDLSAAGRVVVKMIDNLTKLQEELS